MQKVEPIDLRSDTVTKPSPGMRQAIATAEVGDDVIDVDPTLERLERRVAELLGKEAAIFMPSGSMTNQVAIRVHCVPGEEFLCEEDCHIYNYEQAAFAQLSGIVARTIRGECGVLKRHHLQGKVRPAGDHLVRTRLLCLENTHNRAQGRLQPYEVIEENCAWAREQGLARHLDGARLFNAVVASGIPAEHWAQHFDTVSVCFSKGLGAPVGSALAGPRDFVRDARRSRKVFGGGMRQAGILAAAALYALEHNVPRLAEDHDHAQMLADTIRSTEQLRLAHPYVDTNMVIFGWADAPEQTPALFDALGERGVRSLMMGPEWIRLVTHLDVSRPQVEMACRIIAEVATELSRSQPVVM